MTPSRTPRTLVPRSLTGAAVLALAALGAALPFVPSASAIVACTVDAETGTCNFICVADLGVTVRLQGTGTLTATCPGTLATCSTSGGECVASDFGPTSSAVGTCTLTGASASATGTCQAGGTNLPIIVGDSSSDAVAACTFSGAAGCEFFCLPGSAVGVTAQVGGSVSTSCPGASASCSTSFGFCNARSGGTVTTLFLADCTGAAIRAACFNLPSFAILEPDV